MATCREAVTGGGSIVYFKRSLHVHAYDSHQDTWTSLPDCHYDCSSLAVLKGLLTTIGGSDRSLQPTNKLLSLTGEGEDRQWSGVFLPMPTKRWSSTAVATSMYLIVAGGKKGPKPSDRLSTVEVMNIDAHQWMTASSLPHLSSSATATVCRDSVYLLGGNDRNGKTRLVLTCPLSTLIQSCQPQSRMMSLKTLLRKQPNALWQNVADVPVYWSTCTTLCDTLLAVGGTDLQGKDSNAIHMYDATVDSWRVINRAPCNQGQYPVAALNDNKLLVVADCAYFAAATSSSAALTSTYDVI